jgi:hypothetical protein
MHGGDNANLARKLDGKLLLEGPNADGRIIIK